MARGLFKGLLSLSAALAAFGVADCRAQSGPLAWAVHPEPNANLNQQILSARAFVTSWQTDSDTFAITDATQAIANLSAALTGSTATIQAQSTQDSGDSSATVAHVVNSAISSPGGAVPGATTGTSVASPTGGVAPSKTRWTLGSTTLAAGTPVDLDGSLHMAWSKGGGTSVFFETGGTLTVYRGQTAVLTVTKAATTVTVNRIGLATQVLPINPDSDGIQVTFELDQSNPDSDGVVGTEITIEHAFGTVLRPGNAVMSGNGWFDFTVDVNAYQYPTASP